MNTGKRGLAVAALTVAPLLSALPARAMFTPHECFTGPCAGSRLVTAIVPLRDVAAWRAHDWRCTRLFGRTYECQKRI